MLDLINTSKNDIHQQDAQLNNEPKQLTVALLHCYDLIDDFLDSINISLATFCNEFIGSWMFGYIHALKQVGVRTVLFCISSRITEPSRFTHLPTGATICVLPASKLYLAYRFVRNQALNTYGARQGQSFKDIQDSNNIRRSLLTKVKDLAKSIGSYLSTPLPLLAREIRHERCQVILCQEYEYARFDTCVLLGQLLNLPVFASFQGGNQIESFLEYPLRLLALRACTGLIVAPQTEIERVIDHYRVPLAKIACIFNPLDVTVWQAVDRNEARSKIGIPLTAKVVIFHGRIEIERKGLDILLEAWQQICSARPATDLRLLLVGTGPDADKLRYLIANMQLRGVMWVNEFVNDRSVIQRYLSSADVYTLASRQEGFPVAPIEAMACSLPVVAADAPGIPDILAGGEVSGGIVVPREDATALARALGNILDNPGRGQHLGKQARRRVEEYFSLEKVGKQLSDFLLADQN